MFVQPTFSPSRGEQLTSAPSKSAGPTFTPLPSPPLTLNPSSFPTLPPLPQPSPTPTSSPTLTPTEFNLPGAKIFLEGKVDQKWAVPAGVVSILFEACGGEGSESGGSGGFISATLQVSQGEHLNVSFINATFSRKTAGGVGVFIGLGNVLIAVAGGGGAGSASLGYKGGDGGGLQAGDGTNSNLLVDQYCGL